MEWWGRIRWGFHTDVWFIEILFDYRTTLLRIIWALIQSTIATSWLAVARSFGTLQMNTAVWWLASLAQVLRAKRSLSKEPKNVWKQPKSACWRLLTTWLVYFFLFCCFSFPSLFCFWNVTIVPSFFPPTWTSSFSGCSSDHWVRDCSEVPPFHHGSQGLTHPADHQRSQCTDQVPRTWGPTR